MLFDDYVVEELVGMTPEWLAIVLLFIGFLGSVYVVLPGTVIGLVSGGRRRITWPAIICIPYGTFVFVKPVVGLSRPDVPSPINVSELPLVVIPFYELGTSFDTGAFPSGHVLAATVFWGLFVVDTNKFTLQIRAFVAATVVSLVGLSRVALGLHYPGDVVGGVVLGLAILSVAFALRSRLSKPFKPLLLLAAIPSAGGIVAGRPLDGAILLIVIVSLALTHRWVQRTNSDPIRALKSQTRRWSEP